MFALERARRGRGAAVGRLHPHQAAPAHPKDPQGGRTRDQGGLRGTVHNHAIIHL